MKKNLIGLIGKSIIASAQRKQEKKCQSKIFARAFVLIKAQARESEAWKAHIQGAIEAYNGDKDYCVSKAQTIKYFRILDGDFGVESGELTATMKLKRPVVTKKYQAQIESMY